MDMQRHAEPCRDRIAEGNHLLELPSRIDMQQWKWRLRRKKRLLGDMQEDARILADRVQHHRIAELGNGLAHNKNALRLELPQMRRARPRMQLAYFLISRRAAASPSYT